MNYAYNIKVNLNKRLYNFYEWKDADNIIIYNKLDVYVVDDQTYDDILKMRIKADDKQFSKYTCIFTNGIDTVCVRFNDSEEIELSFNGEIKPIILNYIDNDNLTQLILPIRTY